MGLIREQHRIALISCIEIVLMRRGNTEYNLVVAKLESLYHCAIRDCYNPEYLRNVLKEVYNKRYYSIINEIKLELGDLAEEEDVSDFLKVMES